jgi:two-component system response regulator FlrC
MVGAGAFRQDLYYRLAVFTVDIVPLRERREDIRPLADALLKDIAHDLGRPSLAIAPDAAVLLGRAEWPGNVRELRNALERAAILCDGTIRASDLSIETIVDAAPAAQGDRLEDIEAQAIRRTLAQVGGNRRKAAEALDIGLRTLYEKLKRYKIA